MSEMLKNLLAGAIVVSVVLIVWGIEALRSTRPGLLRRFVLWAAFIVLMFASFHLAHGRDLDGRYAASPLKQWFDQLRSAKGPCCSDADGSAVSDADWETKDGRYRVRLEGKWWDVPEDAVLTEPNRAGRTMVWPIYYHSMGALDRIDIRCFIPGSMT